MDLAPRFRIIYAWWPIREVRQAPSGGFEFTGRYYWRCNVNAVKNAYEGWIAFEDQQTEEHLSRCPACNQPLARKEGA